jgi:hypothetical protein
MTTTEVFKFHFERMWKERHTSTITRKCIRQNIVGQRKIRAYHNAMEAARVINTSLRTYDAHR